MRDSRFIKSRSGALIKVTARSVGTCARGVVGSSLLDGVCAARADSNSRSIPCAISSDELASLYGTSAGVPTGWRGRDKSVPAGVGAGRDELAPMPGCGGRDESVPAVICDERDESVPTAGCG